MIVCIGRRRAGLELITFISFRFLCEGADVSPIAQVDYRTEGSEVSHSSRLDLNKKIFLDPIIGATSQKHQKIVKIAAQELCGMAVTHLKRMSFGDGESPKIAKKPFGADFEKKKGPTVH